MLKTFACLHKSQQQGQLQFYGGVNGSNEAPWLKRKVNEPKRNAVCRVAGQRARDPPDPIPNSEVKPCSVSGVSVVFGHVKPEKLVALCYLSSKSSKLITQ